MSYENTDANLDPEVVNQEPEQQPETQPEPYYKSQAEVDAALGKRIAEVRQKITAEAEAKYKPVQAVIDTLVKYSGVKDANELVKAMEETEKGRIAELMASDPTKGTEAMIEFLSKKSAMPAISFENPADPVDEEPAPQTVQDIVNAAYEAGMKLGYTVEQITEMARQSPDEFAVYVKGGMPIEKAISKAFPSRPSTPPLRTSTPTTPVVNFMEMSDEEFRKKYEKRRY